MTHALLVHRSGPLSTLQDRGRPGLAALGISPSGAADRRSHRLANALVGNDPGAACLELTFGGLEVQARGDLVVALAGARCAGAPHLVTFVLRDAERLRLGAPVSGVRTTVAVRGGIDVPEVLGSRSTDVLSGIGPAPIAAGDLLPIGSAIAGPPVPEIAAADPAAGPVSVRLLPGPRRDWFSDDAWSRLLTREYTASEQSNRVGVRLSGPAIERHGEEELPSEGLLRGAIQVPPSGQPIVFLADHPVTGGYPVIGYVLDEDIDAVAQVRPGQGLRFTAV